MGSVRVEALACGVGVDGELAQEFAGGGVHDADVEVVDEQDDGGSGVGSPDGGLVEVSAAPEGDVAGGVDLVVAEAVVGCGGCGGC